MKIEININEELDLDFSDIEKIDCPEQLKIDYKNSVIEKQIKKLVNEIKEELIFMNKIECKRETFQKPAVYCFSASTIGLMCNKDCSQIGKLAKALGIKDDNSLCFKIPQCIDVEKKCVQYLFYYTKEGAERIIKAINPEFSFDKIKF